MASVLVIGQIEKLQEDVLDLSGGLNQTLAQVLANGNSTGGQLINGVGGNIACDAMKCISIECAAFPISTEIAVDADLGMIPGSEIKYLGDVIIRNNTGTAGTDVIIDSIPSAGASLPNVVSYDTASKKLYYQPSGGGGGSQNLSEVLTTGNDADGNIIDNVGAVNLAYNGSLNFSAPTTAPTVPSINGVYNIDTGPLPYPVLRFVSSKAGGTQAKSLTLDMTDGEAIWSSQWEGYIAQDIRTRQHQFIIDGQGGGASTDILCDNVNITPNTLSNSLLTINGNINASSISTSGNITCSSGTIISATGDVISAYSSGLGPYIAVSLNNLGRLLDPLSRKLGIISVGYDISYQNIFYDVGSGGVGTPSSWVPDQQPPVDGSFNTWSHTKPSGAPGNGIKINWFPFNPYYPNPPSIGPVPGPIFTKNDLKAVWAVITPLANISTQGAIFFNIFSYDNVNGSSTYFTNRWDYCANNLALPISTGGLTLQAGFKYLIYCYDAPKIVATPANVATITQANGQFPTQTNNDLMKDPFDIHSDIPHIGFSAVALNITPTPQPSDPTNIPISAICLSTTSSQLPSVLSFNVHSIGYRVQGPYANINYEYITQYN